LGVPGDDAASALARSRSAWVDCVRRGDAGAYAELVTSGVVWVPPGGAAIAGRSAFHDWVARFFGDFSYELAVDVDHVVVRDDWALERGRFGSTFRARSSGSSGEHDGAYVLIWQRGADGRWRIDRYFDTT
jgi:uncharacterized protein (TIGR02246 family)